MTLELYRDRNHCCLMFSDLIEENGHAVQANQFLI
ncbi:MBL fold metallo-hydrolase, partial [Verminephrobacter sp. Larva24]